MISLDEATMECITYSRLLGPWHCFLLIRLFATRYDWTLHVARAYYPFCFPDALASHAKGVTFLT